LNSDSSVSQTQPHSKINGGLCSLFFIAAFWGFPISTSFAQWTEPLQLHGRIDNDPSIKRWPSINETEDTLYYSKWRTGGDEDIFYSYRYDDSLWSEPFHVDIISDYQVQISPCIGPGDSILYYVSYGRAGGYGSYDVWFCRRGTDGQWMEPENAGPNINTPGMEWGVFLSRNGQTLYFSSSYQTGAFLDIKKSTWQENGWGIAEPIPGQINFWDDQEHVTLNAEENYLILTQPRYAATHVDLWESILNGEEWTEPQQIEELNHVRNENGASLMPDGNTAYFASERIDSIPYNSQLYVSHRMNPVEDQTEVAKDFNFISVYPNPFNSITTLSLSLPFAQQVDLSLYNITGRYVKQIAQGLIPAGDHSLIVDAAGLPSGTYFINVNASSFHTTRSIVLVR